MPRKRTPIAKGPSRTQAVFLERFEDAYFAVAGRTLDTLQLGEPPTTERKKPPGWVPGIKRRTYLDWRKQTSSPTIRDLERLCALAGERQTLIVEPPTDINEAVGDDDMGWLDDTNRIIAALGAMESRHRDKLLGKIETLVENAEREGRNPSEPGEDSRSLHARRSK